MNMMSTITDELTRIADECDARGLCDIANEIDATLQESAMRRSAGKGDFLQKLLRMLGELAAHEWNPAREVSKKARNVEELLPKKKWDPMNGPFPAKDFTGRIISPDETRFSRISNPLNRFAQVEGPDPWGDEMTDEEADAFHAQQDEESRQREEDRISKMSPEDLGFYLEEGMSREDFRRMQDAEIAAERGSGDWVSGFRHLGDEEDRMESEMGLESFEEFMDKIRNANRRIDSSIPRRIDSSTNRFDEDENEDECPTCGGPPMPLGRMGGREHLRCRNCGMDWSHSIDVPSDDPNDPDHVSNDELEAASDLLESLLGGKLYEGKEFCPDCNMAMRNNIGKEGKHCPHCSIKDQPRISMNMGGLPDGYIRTASKRSNTPTENINSILERMR